MIDKHSATWREVAAWAEGELSKAAERNETHGLAMADTENMRGRIACLRELLALADEPEPRVAMPAEDYGFQPPDQEGT